MRWVGLYSNWSSTCMNADQVLPDEDPDKRRLDMRRGTAALPALRLAMAVCAGGLPLGAQNCQQPTAARSGVDKSFWTIGIYTGPSPFQLSPASNVKNPVLQGADVKDMNVDTLAHPFMVIADSRYYAFFTAKRSEERRVGKEYRW